MKRIGFRVVASMSLVFFLLTPLPLAAQPVGIWTSPEELLGKPTSGPAWDAVLSGARQNVSHPDLADQDDHTGVYVLAKAIVYTRAPDQFSSYRNEAIASIETLVAKGHPGGRTLAWGRNIGAYVMAADLLGYRSTAFDTYLRHLVTDWKGTQLNRNLHEMFEYMPNNWGTLASGSVIAIYRYLGDAMNLDRVHAHWVRLLGGPTPDVSMSWGSDMSWHADENHPLMINPAGATKNCPGSAGDSLWLGDGRVLIDGLLTAEMRRGGSCKAEPAKTGYAWEGLQGIIVAARAFERAGKPAWKVADSAIYRAAFMLQETLAWKATSNNDGWLLIFLDDAYGTSWAESLNNKYGAGRGAGWGYVLGGGDGGGSDNQAPSVNAGSGRSIEEGETLALNGSVSDDGLPDPPGGLTVRWTRLSGPGTVSFANPASASTTVTFSEPGVYQLQLEADDAEFLSTDVLTVTVQEKSNPTPPASPSGLVAIPLSASEVELRWTDESANEEAFHVEREVQGSFVEIATTDANRSTLLDTNLQPAREYRYRVRASNSTGFSNYSNEAVATTGSSQGTVKSVTPVADTYVKKDDASPHGNEARVLVKGQSFVKRTGYIKFDTSHVTGEISSAKLRLHVASHISWPDPSVIELRELVDSSWDESMNWFNRVPEQAMGAVLDTLSVPIGATTWDIDVTSYATGRRGAGANVISFAFTSTVETNGGLWIQSRETSTPPELVLINSDIIPPSNQPPTASISVDVNAGESPLTVRFDGNASSDVDGRIEQYRWDFGDGTNAEGATAEHVYTITGSYSATLTVTDNEGATGSASVTIRVSSPGDTRLGHTYPLTVVWTWGGPVPEWYAKFDLVVTRETDGELVRRVKSINPDVLWVPQLFDWNAGTEDAERGSMREHHYLHDSNGNRISLYGLDGVWNANLTDVAQPGGERYVDFAPRFMADKISNPTGDPPSEIDGVSTDGIYRQFHYWYDGDYRRMWPDVDLDGNGVNDRVEYGEAWVLNHHVAGVDHLISTLRQQMGDDKIVVLNTGSSEFFGGKNVNGFLFENSSAHFGSWLYNKRLFEQFEQDLRQPIVHMNNWVPEGRDPGRPSLSKNYYTFMRFSLARSMLFGTYFEYESLETGEQYFIKYYDEMDLDVGYPKGPMQQVKSTGPEGEGIWGPLLRRRRCDRQCLFPRPSRHR